MIVLTIANCPPKLRGDLSKWLLEINTGVYVGRVSARVREALWQRVCENIRDGQATMVFTANNEQHMDFYVHNTAWEPVDLDGIKLMKHPHRHNAAESGLKAGFSNAAKQRMGAKKRRRSGSRSDADSVEESFVIIDIETTGLAAEKDEILELGAIRVRSGKCVDEYQQLILVHNEGSLRNVGVVKSICKQKQTAAYQCSNHGISATGGFTSHGYSCRNRVSFVN